MRFWILATISGAITYLTRASFMLLAPHVELSPAIKRALTYVAPSSFAAIAIPSMLQGDGFANFASDLPRIVAFVVAISVTRRLSSVPWGLLAGMGTLWIWLILGG